MSKVLHGLFGFSDMYWQPQMNVSMYDARNMAAQKALLESQKYHAMQQARDNGLSLLRAEAMRNAYKRPVAKRCEFCARACYDSQQEQCNGCGAPV